MMTVGWITMFCICGLVWGGFAFLIARALRAEKAKRSMNLPR